MPLFSDLNSYYYSSSIPSTSHYYHMPITYSVPSRIATPFSVSYLSPLTAMMSAGIGLNPMPRGLMSRSAYTPILPTISEKSSPILSRRELGSPRSIGGKVYYRAPRPVVIDTANIDVSKRKKDEDGDETSTTGKIHRGRSVVRMHTKKLKENPGLKKKKTQGELLMEKFLIKEKPEPKEEPRRRRVWETDPVPENTTASSPQVTPTVSPSTTPICRRGTIKRYISDGKKKSGPLTDVEGTKEDGTSERKVSINELLKEEAAILDSMIQEEMAKSVNEMPTKRKKSGELPDIDDTGTKHKNKTKREGKLYAGKKSSKTLLLDSVDKSDDNMPKRYSSKKSSKTLPLDAINEIANNTLSNGSEDSNLAAEQKQAEGKIVRKSCKSYKKKHSGPLKFIIGTVHVEETSSPKPARKLNYEVIIEESTHRDNGIRETLRDIKKRKSKKSSVKRHYSADEKAEHADTVKIHDKLRSEGLTSIDAFDRHRDVTKLEESVDESNSIKGEIKNEERVPESGVKEKEGEINKSSEKNVEYDGTKLAVKNFLEKIVHKTDLPQTKDNVKHKIEKDAEIIEKSNKAKSAGKDVQNDTPSRDDYYDKFKTFNMLFKNAKENPVTAGNTNEVGVSTKCTDQDNLKQAIGFSLSTADQTKPTDSMQPNTELKSIHSVGKVNNEKIIPNLIKSNEEKKTTKNVEVTKQTESKFLEKLKDVPGPPSSKITETSTEAATGDNKENYKSDYTHDIQSVEKVDIKDTEVVSGSDSKTSKMFKVGERTGKVSDKEITKVTPSKTEINANSKEKLQKADQKVDEKFHSESSKSMEKSTSLAETIYMKHSQGSLQEPGKKQNLNMKKPELSMEIGKVKELDVTDIKKVDNFTLASELMSLSMTENKNVISEKDDSLKGTPAADNLKANEILRTSGEKQTKDPKKDYQDTNKSDDCAPMTSQNEENVTVETNTTDKITSVDFKQLALAKKTKPLVKPRTSDVSTHEVVHESTKIENCKVGGSSEATPLSDKHVDNSLAIVNTTMADTVISSLEIQTCNSELDESESAKENREVNLDSSELNEVAVSEKKQNSLVKVDCSAKKVLDSQSGSTLKEVNCSVVSSDYMKPEVPDIQELKEQVNKTENICDLSYKEAENPLETSTFPKVSSSGSKQPLLSNKIDVSIKALKLDDSVYDANKLIKTEGLSVAGSTSETVPAVIEETDENLVTLSKMKQDKVFSPFEIHPEEQVKSEISGKEGKELVADDTTKTVLHILEVKDVSETAAPIEIAVTKKPDIKTKPVPPKDLKAPDKSVPITGEAEKLKTLGKSESFKETVGTVKENKTVKKSPVEDVTDVVPKETEPGSIKKFAKSSSKDDKQAESISTVKATKSPKSKKPEGSKLSPTKRKLLVKKKSTEEAAGSVEVVTLTDTSEKIVLPSEAESSQKKTEPVTESQKVAENTSVDCSCVKLRSPKKINTVIKVKATDKTVDKSDNSETNSVSKDTDVDKHSENVNLIPSPESSSDESSTEEESSDEEETSSEEETSTESSDDDECDVNCHRKCEKLMPNLCGINQKLIVEALTSVKKGSVESKDKGSPTRRQSNAALSLDSLSSDSLDGFKMSRSGRVTPPATTIPRFRKYCIDDFQFLKVLGKGSFGKVLLAELKGTQYYYAVKCLKKDVVLEDDDVEYTLIERKVLVLGTKHPYLCHLFCTFQTDSHLFFVMEYLNGGDLMFHIQQEGRFDEGRARFYAAEIVSGLKFLHKKGIIYRDLKLDNILLDFDGHVRIADFGMCKLQIYLDKTADSFCGTPDYMAPEIIKGLKYNQCVDWWSFGILLYEMLVGQSPFSGCDEDDLFWCICNRQPQYPRYITIHAKKILSQLLEKESSKRLGSSENGATDIMLHSFFDGLDWQRLERRELMPPFKPNVKHPLDVQYFDKAFTAERARLTPIEPSILQSMDQTQFNGFSYTNPNVTD